MNKQKYRRFFHMSYRQEIQLLLSMYIVHNACTQEMYSFHYFFSIINKNIDLR